MKRLRPGAGAKPSSSPGGFRRPVQPSSSLPHGRAAAASQWGSRPRPPHPPQFLGLASSLPLRVPSSARETSPGPSGPSWSSTPSLPGVSYLTGSGTVWRQPRKQSRAAHAARSSHCGVRRGRRATGWQSSPQEVAVVAGWARRRPGDRPPGLPGVVLRAPCGCGAGDWREKKWGGFCGSLGVRSAPSRHRDEVPETDSVFF